MDSNAVSNKGERKSSWDSEESRAVHLDVWILRGGCFRNRIKVGANACYHLTKFLSIFAFLDSLEWNDLLCSRLSYHCRLLSSMLEILGMGLKYIEYMLKRKWSWNMRKIFLSFHAGCQPSLPLMLLELSLTKKGKRSFLEAPIDTNKSLF